MSGLVGSEPVNQTGKKGRSRYGQWSFFSIRVMIQVVASDQHNCMWDGGRGKDARSSMPRRLSSDERACEATPAIDVTHFFFAISFVHQRALDYQRHRPSPQTLPSHLAEAPHILANDEHVGGTACCHPRGRVVPEPTMALEARETIEHLAWMDVCHAVEDRPT